MKSSINLELSDNFNDSSLYHSAASKLTNNGNGVNENNNKKRFGHKRKSMFFVRHAAIPQHLRVITGKLSFF